MQDSVSSIHLKMKGHVITCTIPHASADLYLVCLRRAPEKSLTRAFTYFIAMGLKKSS